MEYDINLQKSTVPLAIHNYYSSLMFKLILELQRKGLIQFQVVGVTVQHTKELLNKAGEIRTLLWVCSPAQHHHVPAAKKKLLTYVTLYMLYTTISMISI